MNKTELMQFKIDIAQELHEKHYDQLIEYANTNQQEVIHKWQMKEEQGLEQLILAGRHALDFWFSSISSKKLWVALVRCGAWIGTLETIQNSVFEEQMDKWLKKRVVKKISSIKRLPEILRLLELKGIMSHSDLVEALQLHHSSTLSEIMKKVAEFELIDVRKSGKYKLYSLTDAGVRYAKQLRSEGDKSEILQKVIHRYGLELSESNLNAILENLDDYEGGKIIKQGQLMKIKVDDEDMKKVKVDSILHNISYGRITEPTVIMKTIAGNGFGQFYERRA